MFDAYILSKGPEIELFGRLKTLWDFINNLTPSGCPPRDDYQEFARLTIWLLGEVVDRGFCAPGAYHRARWMAKGIYCLKIFGFRHQLSMSKREMDSLRRICLFVCTIYASFWFSAPLATSAPVNDLLMLQLIEDFTSVDRKTAEVAEKKM